MTSTYRLDTAEPDAPSIDAAPPSPASEADPTWAFSAEPGASVECRLDRGATVVSAWLPCTSPRVYSLIGEPDGIYSFSVRAVNAVSLRSVAATAD